MNDPFILLATFLRKSEDWVKLYGFKLYLIKPINFSEWAVLKKWTVRICSDLNELWIPF